MDRASFAEEILKKLIIQLGTKEMGKNSPKLYLILRGIFQCSSRMGKLIEQCKDKQEEVLVLNTSVLLEQEGFLDEGVKSNFNPQEKTLLIPGFDYILANRLAVLDFSLPEVRFIINFLKEGHQVLGDVKELENWISQQRNIHLKKRLKGMISEVKKIGVSFLEDDWDIESEKREVLTQKEVKKLVKGQEIFLSKTTIITPAAKDLLKEFMISVNWKEKGDIS